MEIIILLKGVFVGFAMAVPIGPIGILCIRKTLIEGRLHGLIIGLGAATADLLYGGIAAFGLSAISGIIAGQKIWMRLIGGTLLVIIGLKMFRSKHTNPDPLRHSRKMIGTYLSTMLLTLTNPLTVFGFIAVFAALGLGNSPGYFSASFLVVGVFIGSSLWFLSLNSFVALFRKKMNLNGLRWVNKIAGVFIIISGIIALVSLL